MAATGEPKTAAHAASIKIKEITPALTAFPIFFPRGSLIALMRGLNIIHANGIMKNEAIRTCPLIQEK